LAGWEGGGADAGGRRREEAGRGRAPGSGKGWRGGGGVGAKEEARGRGERWEPGEEGGRAAGASGTTWSERRKETATGKGCGSLVNSRPGSGAFLTLEIFPRGDGWGTGLWIFGGMFCEDFWLFRGGGWDLDGKDIITIFVQQS